ncbi:MAG: hypothetical protein AB4426_12355 [Xenococcaceae cyanobacterium]
MKLLAIAFNKINTLGNRQRATGNREGRFLVVVYMVGFFTIHLVLL